MTERSHDLQLSAIILYIQFSTTFIPPIYLLIHGLEVLGNVVSSWWCLMPPTKVPGTANMTK